MVDALDGYSENGVELDTTTERRHRRRRRAARDDRLVRFAKLGLVDQLIHTVASPPVAYLLLLIGLALLMFEFFTAGVGIAGVVGAGCTILACYGLAALPARGWAVGLLVLAMVAFAIDVQVGIPRFWTGVGIVLTIVGSLWLFEPLPGTSLRPSWITLLAGIGGVMLTFIVGMPSMVRTRFATPTIGPRVDDRRRGHGDRRRSIPRAPCRSATRGGAPAPTAPRRSRPATRCGSSRSTA